VTIYNFIKYYYGLENITLSRGKNGNYIIKCNERIFYLEKVYNLEEVIDQYNISDTYDWFYKFVLNRKHSIISSYEGDFFVLLEDSSDSKRYDNFMDTVQLNYNLTLEWRNLWIKKSDYIEQFYSGIVGKYKIIDESFDYYLGLLELAIYYLNDYTNYVDQSYIQHKTFRSHLLKNPLNIKIDIKERDFAEYLKYLFFYDKLDSIDIYSVLFQYKDFYNYNLVIARMIYPNYYFDVFDKVLLGEVGEEDLYQIIKKNRKYEDYLKGIINYVSTFTSIKKIDWL